MGEKNLEERRMVMEDRKKLRLRFILALATSVILFLPLFAFAGGTNNEPNGVEDYLIGIAPPPDATPVGTFAGKIYLAWYTAHTLKNNSGDTSHLGTDGVRLDKLNVYVDANRFFYVSPVKLQFDSFTGFLGAHAIFPLVKPNLHLDVMTPGGPIDLDQSHSGLADVTFGPAVSWHHKSGLFHFITAVDFVAPTGQYNAKNLVNVGNNVWTIAPGVLWSWFPWFYPNIDISGRFFYSFNTKNDDFSAIPGVSYHKTPGQEFVLDYDIMHALWSGKPGMQSRAGIGGYWYHQTTKDHSNQPFFTDHLGYTFAVGPAAMFDYKMWIFSAHVYWEVATANRPQGIASQFTILCKF
jgi:hypothetical protein